jgi:hypothetical protein
MLREDWQHTGNFYEGGYVFFILRQNVGGSDSCFAKHQKGLSDTLELTRGDLLFTQPLDYEGIPFKCHRCHKHGHRAAECSL